MSADTVIVTPAQLTRFAEFLEDSSKRLRGEAKKMRDSISAAKVVWKDEKYSVFHRELTNCAEELERFTNAGHKYSEFLREKALLANKFLDRR
jgi:hypothetical protein